MTKKINIDIDNFFVLFGIKTDSDIAKFLWQLNTAFNISFNKFSSNNELFKNNLIFKANDNSCNYKIIAKTTSNEELFTKYKELNYYFIITLKTENGNEKEKVLTKLKSLDNIIYVCELNISDINKRNQQILFL